MPATATARTKKRTVCAVFRLHLCISPSFVRTHQTLIAYDLYAHHIRLEGQDQGFRGEWSKEGAERSSSCLTHLHQGQTARPGALSLLASFGLGGLALGPVSVARVRRRGGRA